MVVFAHSGHWLASLMYLLPVIFTLAFIAAARVKDRRRPSTPPLVAETDHPDVDLPKAPERTRQAFDHDDGHPARRPEGADGLPVQRRGAAVRGHERADVAEDD